MASPFAVLLFVLGRCDVSEALAQASVVEPAEVFEDFELELGAAAPEAVADQLGLEAVEERLASALS